MLTIVPGTTLALSTYQLLLSGSITPGQGQWFCLGGNQIKNVPFLGYLLYMTHDHALILLLLMSFYCGLKNRQCIAESHHIWRHCPEGAFLPCALQHSSAHSAWGRMALSHIASPLPLHVASTLSAPAT